MGRMKRFLLLLAVASAFCTGCTTKTVDKLYCLPRRSEEYNNLQSAIDSAMVGLEYCAPISGDNQQTVQMADLTGSGSQEVLLFARSVDTKQLKILIFSMVDERYVLTDTIESGGSAFDQVDYVNMDDVPGVEIVVGRQVSDQVLRSVSVYSCRDEGITQLVMTSYTKFLTCDLNMDNNSELFVLHPGMTDTDNGVAEMYFYRDGQVERSTEVNTSEPMDHLKRLAVGKLEGDIPAVFVASTVNEDAILTDVFALVRGKLANISLPNESGTSVQTLRNYYVYGDDIDNDGVMELPCLVPMRNLNKDKFSRQSMIRWYSMTIRGEEVDKMFTYHNFADGWYFQLSEDWVNRIAVTQSSDGGAEFFLWDSSGIRAKKFMTIYALTGENRAEDAAEQNRIMLARTETVVYVASLEPAAAELDLTWENLGERFHLIYMDWKTGMA